MVDLIRSARSASDKSASTSISCCFLFLSLPLRAFLLLDGTSSKPIKSASCWSQTDDGIYDKRTMLMGP